jgi:hypothetical protein
MPFSWMLAHVTGVRSHAETRRRAGSAPTPPGPQPAPTAAATPAPAATPTPTPTPPTPPLPLLSPQNYSTPHGNAAQNADGSYRLDTIQGIDVDLLPDARNTALNSAAAATRIDANYAVAEWKEDPETHAITITPPSMHFTIQTSYGAAAAPNWISQYGRGTTTTDAATAGHNTLEFHEGVHGTTYVQYLRDHPIPVFPPREGMTFQEFEKARNDHFKAMTDYAKAMDAENVRQGDCIGTQPPFCSPGSQPAATASPTPAVTPATTAAPSPSPTPTPTPTAGTP